MRAMWLVAPMLGLFLPARAAEEEVPAASTLESACRRAWEQVREDAYLHPELKERDALLLAGGGDPRRTAEAVQVLEALLNEEGLVVDTGASWSAEDSEGGRPTQVFRVQVLPARDHEVLHFDRLRPKGDRVTIPFVRKAWVADLRTARRSRSGAFVVRGASGVSRDRAEAEREALADAMGQLRRAAGVRSETPLDPEGIIAARLVRDRYVETVGGRGLYRGYVLVEAGPGELQRFAREQTRHVRREFALRLSQKASLLGLLLACVVGYGSVNAATRGYLRTPLRVVALGLMAAILFGFWIGR
jgi:hypothetical protein